MDQVIAIFIMVGVVSIEDGYTYGYNRKTTFRNNLAEVLTGEGKSVVIAVVAILFALLGKKVNCCCYSTDLSKRDY